MPSLNRLNWLVNEVARGRSAHVSFSYNAATNTEKVKFVLDAVDGICMYRPCVLHALNSVKLAMADAVVTDKGHKHHSSKRSVVEYWVRIPGAGTGGATDINDHLQVASSAGATSMTVEADGDRVIGQDAIMHVSNVNEVLDCEASVLQSSAAAFADSHRYTDVSADCWS